MIKSKSEQLSGLNRRIVLPDWNYDDEGIFCLVYCIVNCLKYYRIVRFPNLNWDENIFPCDIKAECWNLLINELKEKCNPKVGLNEIDFKKVLSEFDDSLPLTIKREKFTESTLNYCIFNRLPPILIYHLGTLYPRTEITMLPSHAGVFLGIQRPNIYIVYDPFWNREYTEYLKSNFKQAWQKCSLKGYVFKIKRSVRRRRRRPREIKTLFDFVDNNNSKKEDS